MEGGGFFRLGLHNQSSIVAAAEADDRIGLSAEDPFGPQVADGLRKLRRRPRKRRGKERNNYHYSVDKAPLLVSNY